MSSLSKGNGSHNCLRCVFPEKTLGSAVGWLFFAEVTWSGIFGPLIPGGRPGLGFRTESDAAG